MTQLAETALVGWRAKVADRLAGPLAQWTPLKASHARALLGVVFFALSAKYVAGTVRRAVKSAG